MHASGARPFKTDHQQGEIAVTQGASASAAEQLLYVALPGSTDHDQLDGRGMLDEIADEGALQDNRVDFDLGVVVHATLQMRITRCEAPIIPDVTGLRWCCRQHPQRSASVPRLVDCHLQNVNAIWRLIHECNNPTAAHRARVAAVASDDCDRAMAQLRQFLCSGT